MKRAIIMGALVGAFAIVASASIAVAARPTAVGGGSFEFENDRYGTVAVTAGPTAEEGGRVNLWVRKPDGELVFHLNGPVTGYKVINASTAVICGEVKVLKEEEPTDKLYFRLKVRDRSTGDTFQFSRRSSEYDPCPGPMNPSTWPERPLIAGNLKVRN